MMKKGWDIKKLGEVCTFINGFAFKSSKFTESGEPIIRISDIQNGMVVDSNVVYFDIDSYSENLSKYKVYPNDILIAMSGGTTGKIGINYTNREFYLNQRVGVFRENNNVLNHMFLFYYLHTKGEDSLKMAAGAAQPNLSTAQIKDFDIPIPTLSEQKEIVEHLDSSFVKIDTLKANAAKNLDEAKALFQSALKEALEPKKGWKEKTLKEVSLSITDGDHMPPPKANEGIPFITISNIDKETNTLNMEDTFYVPEDYYNSLKEDRKPQIGDLLYTVTGSFGIPVVVESDKRFCFQRHIAMIRPDKAQVLCKYLYYWCLSPNAKSEADKVATGTAQRTVSLTSLRKFIIPVPSIKEQEMLISYLYSLERKVNTLQQNYSRICSECDALKQAILKQVFE